MTSPLPSLSFRPHYLPQELPYPARITCPKNYCKLFVIKGLLYILCKVGHGWLKWLLCLGLGLVCYLSQCRISWAIAENVNLGILAQIESSGKADACSYRGCRYGRGLYQVSEVVLKEFDQAHGYSLSKTPSVLFDPELNEIVARWYLTERIPAMLRAYKLPPSIQNVLICFNAGISYLVHQKPIPNETKRYLTRYGGLSHA